MRIIHTSDWHLGRSLCGERLLGDQAYVLEQLTRIADDFHPDAVLVAGDVYDRAIPAVTTLRDLQQGGRLVGIISHVPELWHQIDVPFDVIPEKRGSTARFVVPGLGAPVASPRAGSQGSL